MPEIADAILRTRAEHGAAATVADLVRTIAVGRLLTTGADKRARRFLGKVAAPLGSGSL